MMSAVCNPLSLSAAFVLGLAGSVHCLAMCGGLSGALGMRARRAGPPLRASMHAVSYQIGRIASYTVAGAIVGACGGLLQTMFALNRLAVVARILAGLVLISVALSILSRWRPLNGLERLGGRFWSRIAPLARKFPATGLSGALLLGMLWGFLPCGFIYSMLIFAALAGGAAQAAAMMLCFGLGTAPAVLGASMLSTQLGRVTVARGLNKMAGWLLLAFGTLTLLGPLSPAHH